KVNELTAAKDAEQKDRQNKAGISGPTWKQGRLVHESDNGHLPVQQLTALKNEYAGDRHRHLAQQELFRADRAKIPIAPKMGENVRDIAKVSCPKNNPADAG